MGGHQAGDVASTMVRLSVGDFFEVSERQPWGCEFDDAREADLPFAARRLTAAIRKANRDIFSASHEHAGAYGMGSTVVACFLPPGETTMWIAHVGDSRCYRIRDKHLELLTRDHSLINE